MRSWNRLAVVGFALGFTLVHTHAQTASVSQSKEKTEQMIEDAHRGLFQAPPNTATQAGKPRTRWQQECRAWATPRK
jgi:hypothetical protein